jgi:hypothetical protein
VREDEERGDGSATERRGWTIVRRMLVFLSAVKVEGVDSWKTSLDAN